MGNPISTFLGSAGREAASAARTIAVWTGALVATLSAADTRPNILFILANDLGWSDVGFNGSRYYETPRIDRLAASGMRFTDAYVAAPNCSPSRATLMFGQYPGRTGCYTVGRPENVAGFAEGLTKVTMPKNSPQIPLDKVCLADPLTKAGYATAVFGKWHLGDSGDYVPTRRGFSAGFILPKEHLQDDFGPFTTFPSRPSPVGVYQSDFLAEEALKFMAEKRERPFFVYLSFYCSVHATNQGTHTSPDPAVTAKYHAKPPIGDDKDPVYAAKLEHFDRIVGRLLDRLDELKLPGSTIVILYSDNGAPGNYREMGAPSVRAFTDNRPLRGGKSTLYEGGVRVPLAIRWPGVIAPGSVCTIPVTSVDFYPTLLQITGATAPANQPLDGMSLLPILQNGPRPTGTSHQSGGRMLWSPYATDDEDAPARHAKLGKLDESGDLLAGSRPIFWHFPVYYGNRVKDPAWSNTPNSAVRLGRFKLIEFFDDKRLELYDLLADVGETRNLATKHPEITAQLHALLQRWQKETGAFIPQPRT
jgi:arylsulfatase A-like enzyme